jgi:hypothetical protein
MCPARRSDASGTVTRSWVPAITSAGTLMSARRSVTSKSRYALNRSKIVADGVSASMSYVKSICLADAPGPKPANETVQKSASEGLTSLRRESTRWCWEPTKSKGRRVIRSSRATAAPPTTVSIACR